jgi:hypothetical protein
MLDATAPTTSQEAPGATEQGIPLSSPACGSEGCQRRAEWIATARHHDGSALITVLACHDTSCRGRATAAAWRTDAAEAAGSCCTRSWSRVRNALEMEAVSRVGARVDAGPPGRGVAGEGKGKHGGPRRYRLAALTPGSQGSNLLLPPTRKPNEFEHCSGVNCVSIHTAHRVEDRV